MIKKITIFILFFYLLVLLQTSFFPQEPKTLLGVFLAFFGGFFLDIFSENFFGFWTLISITISIFIKFVFKKYVYPVIKLSAPLEKI